MVFGGGTIVERFRKQNFRFEFPGDTAPLQREGGQVHSLYGWQGIPGTRPCSSQRAGFVRISWKGTSCRVPIQYACGETS